MQVISLESAVYVAGGEVGALRSDSNAYYGDSTAGREEPLGQVSFGVVGDLLAASFGGGYAIGAMLRSLAGQQR